MTAATTSPELNRERIERGLQTSQKFLERSILAIYDRQTADEQSSEETLHHNGVGFNGADARFMSSLASQIRSRGFGRPSGQQLSPKQVAAARKVMKKYAGQLLRIAQGSPQPEPSPEPVAPLEKLIAGYEKAKEDGPQRYGSRTEKGRMYEGVVYRKCLAASMQKLLQDFGPEADAMRGYVASDLEVVTEFLRSDQDDFMTVIYETELVQIEDQLDAMRAAASEARRDGYAMSGNDSSKRRDLERRKRLLQGIAQQA